MPYAGSCERRPSGSVGVGRELSALRAAQSSSRTFGPKVHDAGAPARSSYTTSLLSSNAGRSEWRVCTLVLNVVPPQLSADGVT
jgi:hypothetical protein